MRLNEIEELCERINDCIEFYEKTYIQNKVFTLFLGNGEKVKYTINPDNLAHLLGINLDVLRTTYNYQFNSSFEMLKEVISNSYTLHKLFTEKVLKPEQVFSKNINQKLNVFKDNFKYDAKEILEDTDFVCKFDSKNSWEITDKNQKYNYIIVKTLPNNKIALLGLVKKGFQCYAMSNQLFDSMEEANESLKELLYNQQITLLTGFAVYNKANDSNFNWTLTINQKLEKLDTLKDFQENFNCNINITSDYEYTIHKMLANRNEKRENNFTVEEIVDCIANKKIIERNSYEDSLLLSIIDAWNDHICTNTENSTSNDFSYTEIIKELNAAKELIRLQQLSNENLETKVKELTKNNKTLTEENEIYKNNETAIMKILKPEN